MICYFCVTGPRVTSPYYTIHLPDSKRPWHRSEIV